MKKKSKSSDGGTFPVRVKAAKHKVLDEWARQDEYLSIVGMVDIAITDFIAKVRREGGVRLPLRGVDEAANPAPKTEDDPSTSTVNATANAAGHGKRKCFLEKDGQKAVNS